MKIDKIELLGKRDIMELFKCESDKALRILKVMYQMNMANKIGKEYYVEKAKLVQFLEEFRGQDVLI